MLSQRTFLSAIIILTVVSIANGIESFPEPIPILI